VGQASRLSMTGNPAGRGTVPPTPGRARKIGIPRQEPGNERKLMAGRDARPTTLPGLVLNGVSTVTYSCTVADAVRGVHAQIAGDLL
jgi:hypothetical protein